MRSNLVHNELDKQRNKLFKSAKNEISNNQLERSRTKSTTFNNVENNKTKSNFSESVKTVKILPAEAKHQSNQNITNKKQSSVAAVCQQTTPRLDQQYEPIQTTNLCFFNEKINEKQILDTFCLDENILKDILLNTNIESDSNLNKQMTSIGDKINLSIFQLENPVPVLPKMNDFSIGLDTKEADLSNDLDFDALDQIMNDLIAINSMNDETNSNHSYTSQRSLENNFINDFDFVNEVLVQRQDPMIGNRVYI